jgi:hypothetical protein
MLPVGVADLLPEHELTTAKAAGYAGLANGELIRRAVADGFEVLLTADRNLPAQQNIAAVGIAIVLVPGNRVAEIARHNAALGSPSPRLAREPSSDWPGTSEALSSPSARP